MSIIQLASKAFLLINCFAFSVLLNDALIFGVLPPEYFSELSIVYGFLGNALYSSFLLGLEITRRAEALTEERPKNIYWYIMLFFQPVGAAFFSFILTAVIKTMVSSGSIINIQIENGGSILIGLTSGLFYVYLIKPEFIQKVFKRYVESKILGK